MTSPASQLPELAPGHMLDRYELICRVAQGGMASVWLARLRGKHGFEKLVALKTILPSFAEDKRFRRMLLDEARIAARIEHVNVAQTLDLGEQDGHLFLVMEWVEGDSLSKLDRALERASLTMPLPILLRVAVEACAGLHAAHELCDELGARLGVVHRDVSPQNILVSVKGQTKLIDFGIAKAQVAPSEETRAGILKGKLYYMPPEQALRKPVDRRADVWAVGAVLYRVLSRRTPYESTSPVATLKLLTSRAPPPALPPHVDAGVAELVLRALSPVPVDRPATALQLQDELERVASAVGGLATSQELASFVATHLGPQLRERRDEINKALRSAGGTTSALPPSPAPSPVAAPELTFDTRTTGVETKLERRIEPDTGVFSPSVSSSAVTMQMPSQSPPAPPRSKWPALGLGAAFVAVFGWGLAGRDRPATVEQAAPSKPSGVQVATPSAIALPAPSASAMVPAIVTPTALPTEPVEEAAALPPPVLPSALPLSEPSPTRPPPKVVGKPLAKTAPSKLAVKNTPPKRKVIDDGF